MQLSTLLVACARLWLVCGWHLLSVICSLLTPGLCNQRRESQQHAMCVETILCIHDVRTFVVALSMAGVWL